MRASRTSAGCRASGELERENPGIEILTVPAGSSMGAGYAAAERVLERGASAALAFNDLTALGLLSRLRELGVDVPGELSVAGMDDIPMARYAAPPLTTMSVPRIDIGRQAWVRMKESMADEPVAPALYYRPSLVARESTGPAFDASGWVGPARPMLRLGGTVVAQYDDGTTVDSVLSPRPFLDRVVSRAGTALTTTMPADHPHHLGISLALPDVNGTSYWGGRTYVRGEGSIMLLNQGRQRRDGLEIDGHRLEERLSWIDETGTTQFIEQREIRSSELESGWALNWKSVLTTTLGRITIGSPATNGREGAGYGGIFWRFARGEARVFSPAGDTEEQVHGAATPWVAIVLPARRTTVLLTQPGEPLPWFVRVAEYIGVGPAVAWDQPHHMPEGSSLTLELGAYVVDEVLDAAGVEKLLSARGRVVTALRVGAAGVHGHGRGHVDAALALAREGEVELVAVADPRGGGDVPPGVAVFDDARAMVDRGGLDIVILSTPIPTHADLTLRALAAGAHVLLEKPPVVSLDEHRRVGDAASAAGRSVQVGFQSLASDGVAGCRDLIASGAIGELRGLAAVGLWSRSEEYWRRSAWSGHRLLDGRIVADGAVTNPLAHAIATALAIADAGRAEDVAALRLDLYRANDIEVDDTSSLVIDLSSGLSISGALALTAPARGEPYVLLKGSAGHAVYHYTLDLLHVFADGAALPRTRAFARRELLADLVGHIRTGRPSRCRWRPPAPSPACSRPSRRLPHQRGSPRIDTTPTSTRGRGSASCGAWRSGASAPRGRASRSRRREPPGPDRRSGAGQGTTLPSAGGCRPSPPMPAGPRGPSSCARSGAPSGALRRAAAVSRRAGRAACRPRPRPARAAPVGAS